jgi:outer membrane protein OmpA-like peptidoglycan-associated protein
MRFLSIFTIALLAAVPLHAQQGGVIEELRNSLFDDANKALRRANEERASLLSPTSYARGAEYYREAEATLSSGGTIESIRRDLEEATESFLAAAEQSGLARTTFQTVLNAREDAINAEAAKYAAEQWNEAEVLFAESAVRLERGRLERARSEGGRAELRFREAELIAIKANYLTETRTLLEKADDVRADRHAPASFARATELLAEAESLLNSNRYDTDRPRTLARQAKHNALHAIYVIGLEDAIRRRELTLENVLLDWEASIGRLAELLDVPVVFDEGEEAAIAAIETGIKTLISKNAALSASLSDRELQLDTLIEETASMERLARLVARQERQKQRLATVEALFTDNEAVVFRQEDRIILRMVGLTFQTAKSELTREHEPLLTSLKRALAEFPESNVVIEGHTDSYGSDVDNLALSQRRADALEQYLLDNTPIAPGNLTALGYGESSPVANNETPSGRARNRRIDVIIYPKW